MTRAALLATALAAVLVPAAAAAGPSVWAKARQPRLKAEADLLAQVDSRLEAHEQMRAGPAAMMVIHDAKQRLDRAGAATSTDPVLRYRLAQVEYALWELDHKVEHLQAMVSALRFAAGSPRAAIRLRAEALQELAVVYARLGRHQAEIKAYNQALALAVHAETRALLLANRAEAYMVLGDIATAVKGYRLSLATTPSYAFHELSPTTLWGLAVALDRAGDLSTALEQIKLARTYDPTDARIHGPGWFYVPEYDEAWYAALGYWTTARSAGEPEERLEAYRMAVAAWAEYLDRAPPSDHWLLLAQARHRQCEREHRQARLKASKAKRK